LPGATEDSEPGLHDHDPEHGFPTLRQEASRNDNEQDPSSSEGKHHADNELSLSNEEISRRGAHTHFEQMYISSIEPRARLLYRLCETPR
jgi:hypothetical protein